MAATRLVTSMALMCSGLVGMSLIRVTCAEDAAARPPGADAKPAGAAEEHLGASAFAVAEEGFRNKRYADARAKYQAVLRCRDVPEERQAECHFKIALCHYFEGKFRDAGRAFLTVAIDFPASRRAAHSATYALRAFQERWARTKGRSDYELLIEAKRKLAERTGDAGQSADPEALEKRGRYVEAAERYAKVKPNADDYEESLFRIPNCYLKEYRKNPKAPKALQHLEAALKGFRHYLKWSQEEPLENAEFIKKRKMWQARSVFWLATIHSGPTKHKSPQKIIKLTEGYTTRFPEASVYFPWVWYFRFTSFYELTNRVEAEKCLVELAEFPEFPNLNVAYQRLADMYKKEAASAEKQGLDKARPYYRKCLDYYRRMIQANPRRQKLSLYLYVADMLVAKLQDYGGASQLYEQILKLFGARQPADMEKYKVEDKLAECYFEMKEWESGIKLYERRAQYYGKLADSHPDKGRELPLKYKLAKCYKGAGLHDSAIELFQELKGKVEEDTPSWWDALYEICLARCLKADRFRRAKEYARSLAELSRACDLLSATFKTHPNLGGKDFRAKFVGLAQSLSKAVNVLLEHEGKARTLKRDAEALVKEMGG